MQARSWKSICPHDACALLLACLLHDSALHITEDGFFFPIEGKYPSWQSKYVPLEQTWPEAWNAFLSEAKRFDQIKLFQLFGSSEPVSGFPSHKIDLTNRRKLLAGEFLRRHHARLAYEIALVGIPGDNQTVLKQYFLNIGASFRTSDLWQKDYEVNGHSVVHRTGRFGVGVLAAFLLGSRLRVTTRHASLTEKDGLVFECSQGDELVTMQPCEFHAGTRIKIAVDKKVLKALREGSSYGRNNWDSYCLKYPRVKRLWRIGTQTTPLLQGITVPSCDEDLGGTSWKRINVDGYDDVMWTYKPVSYRDNMLINNGILVSRWFQNRGHDISSKLGAVSASSPSLNIFDPDGRLPLSLQRDRLSGDIPDITFALLRSVSEYFTEQLVEWFIKLAPGLSDEQVLLSADPEISGLNRSDGPSTSLSPISIWSTGIVPVDYDLLSELAPESIILDPTNLSAKRGAFCSDLVRQSKLPYIAVNAVTATKVSRSAFMQGCVSTKNLGYRSIDSIVRLPVVGRKLLIRQEDIISLVSPGNVSRQDWSILSVEDTFGAWVLLTQGRVPSVQLDYRGIARDLEKADGFGLCVIQLDWRGAATKSDPPSAFSSAWKSTIGSALLSQAIR